MVFGAVTSLLVQSATRPAVWALWGVLAAKVCPQVSPHLPRTAVVDTLLVLLVLLELLVLFGLFNTVPGETPSLSRV